MKITCGKQKPSGKVYVVIGRYGEVVAVTTSRKLSDLALQADMALFNNERYRYIVQSLNLDTIGGRKL